MSCFHLQPPLTKGGVVDAKLKFKKYFSDREFDQKLTRNEPGKIENIRRGNFQEIPAQDKLFPDPVTLLSCQRVGNS